jgi:predicted O-methyltransferase YrrM
LRRRGRGTDSDAPQAFPPGAFYSSIVNVAEVTREPDASRVWPREAGDPVGIDLRRDAQLALLGTLSEYQLPDMANDATPPYDPANDQFPPQDAALLYAMIRHLRPRRMVEVGCGWSTTVTARAITDGGLATQLTCIEPYPRDFLRDITAVHQLRQEKVEHTPMDVFDTLEAGDVLFIDSSHVVKTGSDVVHQLLEVVPRLADGVVVHVHDIFIPEDYPRGWVEAGFGWTEQYLLQAYLVDNARAHVVAMNHWLALRHPDAVERAFLGAGGAGSSVWFVTGPEPLPV